MSQGEASLSLRTWEFRGYAPYSEWPKVADAMIEALIIYRKLAGVDKPWLSLLALCGEWVVIDR
jgi:hypothetical protein